MRELARALSSRGAPRWFVPDAISDGSPSRGWAALKIAVHRYKLPPIRPMSGRRVKPRDGALLRVDFEDRIRGYGDCHPWPEIYEQPLDLQIASLRRNDPSSQMERSIQFARIDAEARAQDRSLFDGLEIPRSHASHPHALRAGIAEIDWEALQAQGFDRIKVKAGRNRAAELAGLSVLAPRARDHGILVRLDLNCQLSFRRASAILSALRTATGGDLAWIDWVEDPCDCDPGDWSKFREEFGVRCALDELSGLVDVWSREFVRGSIDALVVKPAIFDPGPTCAYAENNGIPVCVTSFLDHPLGQLCAAWVAANLAANGVPMEQCGLASHTAYEENGFSRQLGIAGGRLVPPSGTGFGFDGLLNSLEWEEVA